MKYPKINSENQYRMLLLKFGYMWTKETMGCGRKNGTVFNQIVVFPNVSPFEMEEVINMGERLRR